MEYRDFKDNENDNWNCEVSHPVFGWIPYTVSSGDEAVVNKLLLDEFIKNGLIPQ